VRSRIHRGRQALRDYLAAHHEMGGQHEGFAGAQTKSA